MYLDRTSTLSRFRGCRPGAAGSILCIWRRVGDSTCRPDQRVRFGVSGGLTLEPRIEMEIPDPVNVFVSFVPDFLVVRRRVSFTDTLAPKPVGAFAACSGGNTQLGQKPLRRDYVERNESDNPHPIGHISFRVYLLTPSLQENVNRCRAPSGTKIIGSSNPDPNPATSLFSLALNSCPRRDCRQSDVVGPGVSRNRDHAKLHVPHDIQNRAFLLDLRQERSKYASAFSDA